MLNHFSELPIGSQRSLFDVPPGIAYFNTAYNAPQLNESRARLVASAAAKSHPWKRSPGDFFDDAERIRVLAAELFGGDADGWAVVPAASYGVSTAARAIEPTLNVNDRIVLLGEEFPSNVLPWRRVAAETGATIVTVPAPADGDWTAATLTAIRPGVRVVAAGHCHWTNGARLDLSAVARACRAVGAALVLDATQSLGAMPLDLADVQPDFLVAAGYKWLLCPYGFGLLYVSPAWRDARPLEETWLARENSGNFATLVQYNDIYLPGARRFEVGEKCTSTILPGAIAALEQLQRWTLPVVARSLATITARIQDRLEALGFELPPPAQRCPHLFGARMPSHISGNLVGSLRERNVFVSQRGSSIRFAPHLHITEGDIEQLFAALPSSASP
jgi:selenocysteine lyase/cysteine desulfurase